MAHRVTCACGKSFGIREDFAGRTVLCPGCKAPHVVPRPKNAPASGILPIEPIGRPPVPAPPAKEAAGEGILSLEPVVRPSAPVPKRTCPQCRELSPVGPPNCPSCGFHFEAGRELRARAGRIMKEEEERTPGFFQLGAGMFLHPFATMENLLYHAGEPALMVKILLFFLATIPMAGYLEAEGDTSHLLQGCGRVLLEFLISAGCILMAGRLTGQGGTFLGAIVALGFARGFVFILAGGLILAAQMGVISLGAIAAFVLVLWIATVVLNVVTIMSIFACEAGMAILISIVAGIIQNFALRIVGVE